MKKEANKMEEKEKKLKIGRMTVIHCPTEELANKVLKIVEKLKIWSDAERFYLDFNYWDAYKENTVFYFLEAGYGDIKRAKEDGYKIMEAEDFIKIHTKESNYKIGDIVPYKNTRSNIKMAKITSFETVENGKTWFHGINIETKAKVFYPVHISKVLLTTEI